jgi:hypothetical protein
VHPHGITPVLLGLWVLAVALHVYEALTEWTSVLFGFGVLAWSLIPYIAAGALASATRRTFLGIAPTALALLFDLYTLFAVRSSHGSTAALAYLWTPFWNLILVVPLSAGGVFLWVRLWHADRNAP